MSLGINIELQRMLTEVFIGRYIQRERLDSRPTPAVLGAAVSEP
jgi:hypothetical protein